jgi:peptide deformylase
MPETKLKIRLLGDPGLRKASKPVRQVTEGHRQVLSQMAGLMYESSGVGLAASQVGIYESMIVTDTGSGLYKLINPRVVKKEGTQVTEEGCLSVPGICIKVKRAREVLVKARDENGKPVSIEARDLLACVFQHEIDHLKGRLIVDYASFWERLKISRKLKGLKRGSRDEKLSEPEAKSRKLQL